MKRLALITVALVVAGFVLARHGGHLALALPQHVKIVSVSCAVNPEITVIQNTGLLSVSLSGFAINDITPVGAGGASAAAAFYPLPPGLSLNPGQIQTFFSGPAAPPVSNSVFTLTRLYIYNHALARSKTEGAVLTFNAQVVSTALCAEAATPVVPTPSPAPTSPPTPQTASTPTPTETPTSTAASSTVTPTLPASSTRVATSNATSGSPTPSATPRPSPTPSATATATAGPTVISYAPGWNLVGGPGGTIFGGAEELLAPSLDGSGYVTADPQQPAAAGFGYWAYFSPDTTDPQVTLAASSLQTLTLDIQPGVWSLIGNPTSGRAAVTGADAVETYSPANGYELVTDLAPGQGALVFSYTGNQITLTAEAGTVSGSPQQSLPAGTPAATAPVGGSPTPAQTASPPQTIPTALPPQ